MNYRKSSASFVRLRTARSHQSEVLKMRQWVQDRVGPQALKLMERDDKYSIDKTARANLLAMDDPEEVPPNVADVIQCADDLWASSVAKFKRLFDLADEEHRVRGAFVFAGGSATGRAGQLRRAGA